MGPWFLRIQNRQAARHAKRYIRVVLGVNTRFTTNDCRIVNHVSDVGHLCHSWLKSRLLGGFMLFRGKNHALSPRKTQTP